MDGRLQPMEDTTGLSVQQVIALLEGIKASTYALKDTTKDEEHEVMFAAIAGFANILIELLSNLLTEEDVG